MRKRVSRIVNFIAFNLLFFALYLNFIHKDSNSISAIAPSPATVSVTHTVLVENPEQYLKKEAQTVKKENHQVAQLSLN